MPFARTLWTFFICGGAIALGVVAVRQARANQALKGEAAALRSMVQTLNTEQVARQALVNLEPKGEEIKELSDNETDSVRLRAEIERLDGEIAGALNPAKSREAKPSLSAYSRLRSVLAAARVGDTADLVNRIRLTPSDQKEAEVLFAQIPDAVRAQYPSAKHLMAAVVGITVSPPNTKGVGIFQEKLSPDQKSATYRLGPRGIPPTPNPPPVDCVFQRAANDDWLLVVSPEMMASYRRAVASTRDKK